MIRLTSPHTDAANYVAPQAIARITEADASSQWHGTRAWVKLFDGTTLECRESAREISEQVAQAARGAA